VKDIDDLLRAVGRESAAPLFAGLLDRARPAVEHLLDELRAAPPEAKSDLAERFARIVLRNPPIEQAALRKRMAEILGVGARTVQQVIAHAREGLTPSHIESFSPAQPAIPVMGDSYCRWTAEGLQKIEYHELDGQTVESAKLVSNFVVRIEREAEVIDDLREHSEYECRLIVAGMPLDAPGRPFRLEASHFGSNSRLAEDIAAAGHGDLTCAMADMDFVRMVSSAFFREKGRTSVKVVRYVGYASSSGKSLGYVTPSVVVRDGEILTAADAEKRFGFRCELPPDAFKSVGRLDLAIISDDEFRLACRSVLDDLLAFKGPGIGRACVGHTFLAPVIGRLSGFKPYVLALVGGTGVGKTTLAGYFQSFFGPTFGDLDLESWTGTPKAVELAGHVYKDALYVVDDFKLAHFGPGALRDAMRVLQGYSDGSGRNRLTRGSEMRKTAFIRGLLMITGEDLPEGESSNLARIVPLQVPETPLVLESVARKRRCDEARGLYAGVMARYIAWTQGVQDAALRDKVARHFEVLASDSAIERVAADNKPRLVQNLALNCFGFALWAEFMCESGLLDEPAARSMVQDHFEFLKAAFAGHVEAVNDERPFVLFLRDLRSMVASEVVRLEPVTRKPDGGFVTDKETGDARRPLVGYRDLEHVYLLDGPAFKEVGEYRARGRINAGEFSKRAVMRQLLDEGLIVANPARSGTNDVKKHAMQVNGEQRLVVKIPGALFEGTEV